MISTLLAAALAGAVSAAEPFPEFPGSTATPIGNALAYFVTPASIAEVSRYYAEAWSRLGYPTLTDRRTDEAVVTAFFTREGLQRSAVIQRRLGQTLVFLAKRDLWKGEPPGPAPPLEGALFAQVEKSAGSLEHSWIVDGSVERARDQVEARLRSEGFQSVTATRPTRNHALLLEHVAGARRVITAIAELGDGLTSVFQVEQADEEGRR